MACSASGSFIRDTCTFCPSASKRFPTVTVNTPRVNLAMICAVEALKFATTSLNWRAFPYGVPTIGFTGIEMFT